MSQLNASVEFPFLLQTDTLPKDPDNLSLNSTTEDTLYLALLTCGAILNASLVLSVLFSRAMHTSLGCYLLSLICSDLILLSDVLREVLLRYCGVNFQLNLDYVSYVTFEASVLTLAMLSLDRYVLLCRSSGAWRKIIPTPGTAAKSVVVIWCMSAMTTAMQLHLQHQLVDETFGNLFVSSTVMFVALPTAVIVFLSLLMFCEGATCDEANRPESLLLLAGLTIGFFVTMVPRRVALIINFFKPLECCSEKTINMYYMLTNMSCVLNPVVWFVICTNVRNAMQNVFCKCRWDPPKNPAPLHVTNV